ncbi:MAG: hypothetical protein MI784_01420 [Cytophagales bacterium]|nr:hypothetical protein [Cytophagales bacterium]
MNLKHQQVFKTSRERDGKRRPPAQSRTEASAYTYRLFTREEAKAILNTLSSSSPLKRLTGQGKVLVDDSDDLFCLIDQYHSLDDSHKKRPLNYTQLRKCTHAMLRTLHAIKRNLLKKYRQSALKTQAETLLTMLQPEHEKLAKTLADHHFPLWLPHDTSQFRQLDELWAKVAFPKMLQNQQHLTKATDSKESSKFEHAWDFFQYSKTEHSQTSPPAKRHSVSDFFLQASLGILYEIFNEEEEEFTTEKAPESEGRRAPYEKKEQIPKSEFATAKKMGKSVAEMSERDWSEFDDISPEELAKAGATGLASQTQAALDAKKTSAPQKKLDLSEFDDLSVEELDLAGASGIARQYEAAGGTSAGQPAILPKPVGKRAFPCKSFIRHGAKSQSCAERLNARLFSLILQLMETPTGQWLLQEIIRLEIPVSISPNNKNEDFGLSKYGAYSIKTPEHAKSLPGTPEQLDHPYRFDMQIPVSSSLQTTFPVLAFAKGLIRLLKKMAKTSWSEKDLEATLKKEWKI